ncbi:MAG TPA: type II secretion system F family protein [Phenylobacterium sp.]|uniref:type II secretion system F family protein n=1 Tax=Phenylobacterium sp. TaxID=1871053 RepID=UPI002B49A1EA|nr:type II secretion system F family protein [Phenylobacterium sp.]HKR88702.1 type II secretion system F family protein [Phenylobacterium sp.]
MSPAHIVFLILVFGAVFTAGQAVFGLFTVARQKRQVNQRLKIADKVEGVSALVMELRKQRGLSAEGKKGERLRWLSDLIVASGLTYEPRKWAMMAIGAGFAAALLAALILKKPLIALPVGLIVALVGPIAVLKFKAAGRSKALGFQLPQALEIIVRSLEAGHPVPTAVALVGREMPDPCGTEFGMTADEIAYGATLAQAVERMAERCQHADVDLFAATIRLQERSGGNLTGLLKLNASTVRERQKMRLKIKAASSEGRASAMILTAAPILTLLFINVTSPHFYGDVAGEPTVKIGLGVIGVWLLIGNLVMRRMIDMRI